MLAVPLSPTTSCCNINLKQPHGLRLWSLAAAAAWWPCCILSVRALSTRCWGAGRHQQQSAAAQHSMLALALMWAACQMGCSDRLAAEPVLVHLALLCCR